ncbi:protein NETWORKED 3C-like [Sesamum indicum]|uniref:Protein NETWORKED 3C-like n=1 Tax=Sesamum indicum TaxID=4182 RepID=A0A6I9TMJ4_SESIN|nr:protein NETWORKED 3C-like [Sesamum indicum]
MELGNINNRCSRDDECSPYSWWWDSHHRRPSSSHWLHSTLSELDDKIKTILELIEDDGETFAKRAEMYYRKKPQLIDMIQDLHSSYRSLADKYDQLRSESSIKTSNNESISSPLRKMQPFEVKAPPNSPSLDQQTPNRCRSESYIEDYSSTADSESGTSSIGLITHADNKVWDEVTKFPSLLEETVGKQAELVRRNHAKRQVMNELWNENTTLLSRKTSSSSSSHKGASKGCKSHRRKFRSFFCLT